MNKLIWDCKQVFCNLSNYLDDALSVAEKNAFQQHVANCQACSRFGNEFFTIIQSLKQLPEIKSKEREQKIINMILGEK